MFLGSDHVHVTIKALCYALTFGLDEFFRIRTIDVVSSDTWSRIGRNVKM
jgi:hypothetical protein